MSLLYESELSVEDNQPTEDEKEAHSGKGRILIVEDSDDIRSLLVELLEDEGYRVVTAGDGEEGLRHAEAHRPQLILMDLSLPGMDGWETVRQLRQKADFADLPIVALTAHATKRDEQMALEAGCTSYISKPFDMDHLLVQIETYIAR